MNTTTPPATQLITRAEAAAMLRLKEQTLACWASTGRHALPFVKCGARVMYRRDDIERWMAERSGTSTRQIAANA